MTGPTKKNVLDALGQCGRDRSFFNDGTPASVALRWLSADTPDGDKWIVGKGTTHDEAGFDAACAFASKLREHGERLIAWADRIGAALDPDAACVCGKKRGDHPWTSRDMLNDTRSGCSLFRRAP